MHCMTAPVNIGANHIKQKLLQWEDNLTKNAFNSVKFKYISFQIRDLVGKKKDIEKLKSIRIKNT